jgi:uncharacterized protein (TIGR03790 family)
MTFKKVRISLNCVLQASSIVSEIRTHLQILFFIFCALVLGSNVFASTLKAKNVAVVVNDQDKNSMALGAYYLKARKIPKKNWVRLSFDPKPSAMDPITFASIREKMLSKLGPDIQVIVLVWTTPYAVGCNSITSAVTLGYNAKQCLDGCAVGEKNPYFDSLSEQPFQTFQIRVSMLMPADSIKAGKALIDKAILAGSNPKQAIGYFLKTNDDARSKPREPFFPRETIRLESKLITLEPVIADSIRDKKDLMFYFTGAMKVAHLDTLHFLPGAIADHLTSTGGVLRGGEQMPSTKWLEAGATGSYGTVSEPCNYWQKFPNPHVLVKHYLAGDTLVEAYWKSVYWPAQGLFLGEPLAAPFR